MKAGSKMILGDCIPGMKDFEDGFFDLAIVDPPYGINAPMMNMGSNPNRKEGGYPSTFTANRIRGGRLNGGAGKLRNRILNRSTITWDNEQPPPEYWEELFRVSKNVIVWGGNYFDLGPTRCFIAWDKLQPWENFSQVEQAWTSFDMPSKIFRHSNTGGANAEEKIHPTQKPVELYRWCLNKFAKEGDKILDTHAGSQSSRIAAVNMGFHYWGWEINEEYFHAGNKRFQLMTAQTQLFT